MNGINTLSATTTKVNHLLDKISSTCDALASALDMTTEKAAQYGGGVLQSFDSEFVDVVIKVLLQLKIYTVRLQREVLNGLIQNPEDLTLMVQGMQDLSDQLNTLMMQDGRLRTTFEFWLREIDQNIHWIIDSLEIN